MPDAASSENTSSTSNGPFFNIDDILGKNSGSDEANFQQLFKPNVRNMAAPVFRPLLRPGLRPASVRTTSLLEQGDQHPSSASQELLSVSKADSEDRSAATIPSSTRKFVPLLRSKGGRAPFRQLAHGATGAYDCTDSPPVERPNSLATSTMLQPQTTITQGQSANMPNVVSSQTSSSSPSLNPKLAHVIVSERRDEPARVLTLPRLEKLRNAINHPMLPKAVLPRLDQRSPFVRRGSADRTGPERVTAKKIDAAAEGKEVLSDNDRMNISSSASTISMGDAVGVRQKNTSAEICGEEKPKGIKRILTPAVPRAILGSIQRPSVRNLPLMHAPPLVSASATTERQISPNPSSTSNAAAAHATVTSGVEHHQAKTVIRERSQSSALLSPSLGEDGHCGSKPKDDDGVSPTDMEVSRDPLPQRPITPQRRWSRSTPMSSREDGAYHSPPATPQTLAAHEQPEQRRERTGNSESDELAAGRAYVPIASYATRGGEQRRTDESRGGMVSNKRIHSGSTMQPPVPQNLFELSQNAVQRANMYAGQFEQLSKEKSLAQSVSLLPSGTQYQRPSTPAIEARDWKTICTTIVGDVLMLVNSGFLITFLYQTQEVEQATRQALDGIEQDNRFTLRQHMELDQIDRTMQILRSEIADQRARILNMACDMLILLRDDELKPPAETRDSKKRKRNEMDEGRDASPLEASHSIPVVMDTAHALKLTPLDSQTGDPGSDHVSSSGEGSEPISNTKDSLQPISTVKHDKQDSDNESVDLM
ncbi:uncharacterized protein SPPG_04329 [Spizellomyces punctatus DAOM BR117]|uniref:Uncharacterized protein n=1 Tax=Spizellomyces punctatus (strain DAOM BR117) TaxID=645134 RepID=A0A0L0HJN0_SPIPD|nr:uncharacterized protein SPPG_04329 [Spizellomyces punctatus DAOM BR117]KND01238.1 hypothetical protein SPPG_04329 [Spizellomyces punctatus DAOM BR117]|eukprot:XP_016609277.1 hypothetical protein SPPG_04329 [Spizellomyces punctatus DAOM BR117]